MNITYYIPAHTPFVHWCLDEKLTSPRVLASWLMVYSFRVSVAVLVWHLSCGCTDTLLTDEISLFPG